MNILIACEYSGRVREAFSKLGHTAWSCDYLPTEIPGNHYHGDVRDILCNGWDMVIAFPPCTYLCYAGVQHLHTDPTRWDKMVAAAEFFNMFLNCGVHYIAVENPVPHGYAYLPKYSQIVHPYFFGDAYAKRTCLWLKNLPLLTPTNMVEPVVHLYNSKKTKSGKSKYSWQGQLGKNHGKERSITPEGLAQAMASQWSNAAEPIFIKQEMNNCFNVPLEVNNG